MVILEESRQRGLTVGKIFSYLATSGCGEHPSTEEVQVGFQHWIEVGVNWMLCWFPPCPEVQ